MTGSDGVEALNGSVISNQWSARNGQGVRGEEPGGEPLLVKAKGPRTISLDAWLAANFFKQAAPASDPSTRFVSWCVRQNY
jgi:hypothetical protein